MLEPTWIEHHYEFDVFHVLFGFAAIGPEGPTEVVQARNVGAHPQG
jgi:hypothetical protein